MLTYGGEWALDAAFDQDCVGEVQTTLSASFDRLKDALSTRIAKNGQ